MAFADTLVMNALVSQDHELLVKCRADVEKVLETGNFFRTRHNDPYYVLGLISAGLGELDRAAKEFQQAIERDELLGAKPDLAKSLLELSKVLIKRNSEGDHDRAEELQDQAIAIATELGMKPLLEKVLAQREILKA